MSSDALHFHTICKRSPKVYLVTLTSYCYVPLVNDQAAVQYYE